MTGAPSRVFVARLAGTAVFDPQGDQVGRVRDVVATMRPGRQPARIIGLVIEVPGRRRVFVPMTRVTSMDAGQVITTGLVNMRRFEQRPTETLLLGELLDRTVTLADGSGPATIEDLGIEQLRPREWRLTKVFVRRGEHGRGLSGRLRRRGETFIVDADAVVGLAVPHADQGATNLLAAFDELKAADLADVIHELTAKRRKEVAAALDDERLADVLEELPEDDQVEILSHLEGDRAAHVLEAMQPDDAADLLSELPPEQAERLLELMEPDDAESVRRLLAYDERTAGGLMTTDPVMLGPEATIAEALAHLRRQELTPTLAAAVFVCRPPLETPTGRFLGVAHIQRLLREAPHIAVGQVLDKDVETLGPDDTLQKITRYLATYNLVSAPVVDEEGHLLGAVTVDDVLDHLLPDDWRDEDEDLLGEPSAPGRVTARQVVRGVRRG
ncbi:Mg/Co/Ni transporter MgtE [Kineococcus xinjiangensis]|uniref:Mg/Co/Ni transporter MgtE n=1 Tax=Kineococcus xinjiangensis TaxID=512762 RepID=A0A2S6IWT8_9ACTN|nr:CBS domain-containing protein [Kineococcus xinjiangensis]PPK98793.1 Mg/Co/Ni transporter MgtE [Kineococcus xinjiangensis]